ncbi:hypothetical protein ACJ41O_000919 [Fusarium nematophilum]
MKFYTAAIFLFGISVASAAAVDNQANNLEARQCLPAGSQICAGQPSTGCAVLPISRCCSGEASGAGNCCATCR